MYPNQHQVLQWQPYRDADEAVRATVMLESVAFYCAGDVPVHEAIIGVAPVEARAYGDDD